MRLHIFKHILAGVALMAVASPVMMAQHTQSGYFLDGYMYRYRMNPAIGNDSTRFVAVPAIGNLNVAARGNLHVSDIFYNVNGRTTTFMNPGVTVAELMDNIGNNNRLSTDVNVTLLAGGFKAWGGYNTVTIGARANAAVRLPREVFSLLKEGVANQSYDIRDIGAHADAFAEIAFGHSRDINKQWRVGGTLKFLLGGANMDAKFKQARLDLGVDNWSVVADAELQSSVKGLTYKTDVNDDTHHRYVSGIDVDGTGLNGFGMALDLGAVYTLNQDWQFSASVLDFGFIHWNNNIVASTNGERQFYTDRYTFNADNDADNSFDNEWKKLRNDFSAIYELDDMGDRGGRTTMLSATLNFAGQYTLPVYRNLTFGLMNTTKIQGAYSWTDFRLSANVAPVKIFSATANMAVGSYGCGFGWLANLHVTGFNLFLGMDHTLGKLTKDGVPLSSNASVNFGMNVLF
ncbi:MAG: hypothetical protein K1V76_01640 [Candidatus Amulumruptor sp.]